MMRSPLRLASHLAVLGFVSPPQRDPGSGNCQRLPFMRVLVLAQDGMREPQRLDLDSSGTGRACSPSSDSSGSLIIALVIRRQLGESGSSSTSNGSGGSAKERADVGPAWLAPGAGRFRARLFGAVGERITPNHATAWRSGRAIAGKREQRPSAPSNRPAATSPITADERVADGVSDETHRHPPCSRSPLRSRRESPNAGWRARRRTGSPSAKIRPQAQSDGTSWPRRSNRALPEKGYETAVRTRPTRTGLRKKLSRIGH